MPEETLFLTPPPELKGPLAPDKEIDLLIKSIEEASKHTKDTLLVLLAASFYILVAVFSTRTTDTVPLPILAVTVSNNVFLALSPVIVLFPYLYLQLCISDLRVRLRAFAAIDLDVRFLSNKGLLLFPFLVTKGLIGHEDMTSPGQPRLRGHRFAYAWTVTVLLVWVVAPAILLTLWLRFIDRQQIQSLIPGVALIATIYGTSMGSPPSQFRKVFSGISSVLLVLISIASVASLRSTKALATVWSASQKIGNVALHGSSGANDRTFQILIVPLGVPLVIIFIIGKLFFPKASKDWSTAVLSRFPKELIKLLLFHNDPWKTFLFCAGGIVYAIVFLTVLLRSTL